MKAKRSTIIIVAVFLCSLIVATFFDLEISKALHNNSSSLAHFFRNYGELPAFAFLAVALSIVVFKLEKKAAKPIKIVLRIALICADAFLFTRFVFVDNQIIKVVICGGVAITLVVFVYMFLISEDEKMLNELVKIAIMVILIVLISNLVVQLLKLTFGRVRFRDLIDDYTSWYIIKGNNGNKSFPSGHTVAASNILCVTLFFDYFKVRKKQRLIITSVAIMFVVLTALSRIILGAHYLSDVIIGGFIGYFTLQIIMNFSKRNTFLSFFKTKS